MPNQWLTPDAPNPGFICRRLLIPNGVDFLAIVSGALLSLTYETSFEQFGGLTPAQTAQLFFDMFSAFTFDSDGGCRMVGEIIPYAGPNSPRSDWILCNGASLLRVDFPDLFTVVGTTYGAADISHFNIPDLRGRVPLDYGAGSGLTNRVLGSVGGEENHVLSVSELAAHTHTDAGHTHLDNNATPTVINGGLEAPAIAATSSVTATGSGNASLTDTGSDSPHNNMQPFLAINYLIVAQ